MRIKQYNIKINNKNEIKVKAQTQRKMNSFF